MNNGVALLTWVVLTFFKSSQNSRKLVVMRMSATPRKNTVTENATMPSILAVVAVPVFKEFDGGDVERGGRGAAGRMVFEGRRMNEQSQPTLLVAPAKNRCHSRC